MVTSLKNKTIGGLLWSFLESFSKQGITFIVGIILARILTPEEFGLIGMVTVFIAISTSIIDSGFTQALIRKQNCTNTDYSTAFYFNLVLGGLLFLILFLTAPVIADFFDEPQLRKIVKILALVLIIDSFTIIQRAQLIKRIDFRLQTKITVIADVLGGGLAIFMAFKGFGVWSLVWKQISQKSINALLLWIWNRWTPALVFSLDSFKELFNFGYKLLLSGLINTTHKNIYHLVIGKFFAASDLGFFTRADQFKRLPSKNITTVIQRVTYPVLSSIQDDTPRLKRNYQKLIRATMFLTFSVMIGVAAVAKPLILTLIGEKWLPSVVYLQMLAFVGMLHPLQALNLNMLNVQGRSDLFLKLEVIKKLLAIPAIILGVFLGIKIMIAGMVFNAFVAFFINSYWSGKLIGYSSLEQIKDILPSFLLAISMGITVYSIDFVLPLDNWLILFIQVIIGAGFIFGISERLKLKDYLTVKEILLEKLRK